MKLSVAERMMLNDVLPREGNSTNLRIIRELREHLSFTEVEWENLVACEAIIEEQDNVKCSPDHQYDKDVSIGPVALDIIKKAFKRLEDMEKLREEYIPLFDKFMETEVKVVEMPSRAARRRDAKKS